jgi:F-type H+-transporting ATPase subunit delta
VANTSVGMSGLAGRYAGALFDLAKERGLVEDTVADLLSLSRAYDGSTDLQRLVRSPVAGREEQSRAMVVLTEKLEFTRLTRNFIGLLATNRRLFALRLIIDYYVALRAKERGEMAAEVVSAAELTSSQKLTLEENLKRAMGRNFTIAFQTDATLLGGLVVKLGSLMVDHSLRSKLQHMQLIMKGVG